MPNYEQVWLWHTDIFALCFWLTRNYKKICFRNISSAKLKWNKCTRRIKHDCFFLYYGWLKLDFILNFPCALTHFSSWCFFVNCCYLLSFLKDFIVTIFCIISYLFHHKYNQFPGETSLSAKPILDAEVL